MLSVIVPVGEISVAVLGTEAALPKVAVMVMPEVEIELISTPLEDPLYSLLSGFDVLSNVVALPARHKSEFEPELLPICVPSASSTSTHLFPSSVFDPFVSSI